MINRIALDDSDPDRNPMDVLAEQFSQACRAGESPSIEEYAATYPDLADQIRNLFPSIEAIEKLGSHAASENRFVRANAAFDRNRIEQVGDYRIVREIGRGGMGIVYEAIQQSLGRHVAIKLLLQTSNDPKHLRRFEREARTAANLHHTNIVPVFGVGSQDGYHYYVMQLIDGEGLDQVIEQCRSGDQQEPDKPWVQASSLYKESNSRTDWKPLSTRDRDYHSIARIAHNVADALQYAHEQGTLHRDIKPANLLLDDEGCVWITDFGLAKAMEDSNVSRTGDVVGTLRFMAPEQFAGQPDPRSDVYSLGLTIYELLTLTPAYEESSRSHLLSGAHKQHSKFPSPKKLDPKIPRDLETIVMKACAREPAQRYQSAGDLASDLENFIEGRPIKARPPSAVESFSKWCRRNPAIASLSAVATLLLTLTALTTTIGYCKVTKALQNAKEERTRTEIEKRLVDYQRDKAESTLAISLQALDKVYKRFVPDRLSVSSNVTLEGVDGEQLTLSSQPMLSRETAALLEDVLEFYDQFSKQDVESIHLKREAAKANRRVGDIHRQLGDFDKSTMAYLNAIAMYSQIDNSEIERARIVNALGQVHRQNGELREARQSFLDALDILKPLAINENSNEEARFETARTLYLLAKRKPHDPQKRFRPESDNYQEDRRPPPRRPGDHHGSMPPPMQPPNFKEERQHNAWLRRAISLLKELNLSDRSHPEYRFLLALCFRESDKNENSQRSEQAIEVLEELCDQFPDVPEYQHELGITLAEVPVHNLSAKNAPDSIQSLRASLKILDRITQAHPNIPVYTESCAHTHHKLGTLLRKFEDASHSTKASRFAEAEKHLREAVNFQTSICSQFPESVKEKIWLARMRDNLANCLLESERPEQAFEMVSDSILESQRYVAEDEKEMIPAVSVLMAQYKTKARILEKLGRMDEARDVRREAEDIQAYLPPPRPPQRRRGERPK